MILPTLYKKTSTGAIQTWSVEFSGKQYSTIFGQENGNLQASAPTTCIGKQGRSDEEQAEFEARALWTKKLKKDYVKTREEALIGKADALVEGGILPMLAHKFSDHGDKLVYPCFVQPKLDGHRCISWGPKLWSRTRKEIKGCPHIPEAVELLDRVTQTPLDGELYNHDYHNRFEELTHFIRQTVPLRPACEVVQYHVYDACMPGTFRDRWEYLCEILGPKGLGPIHLVETWEVQNEDELMLAFEDFLEQGYEGAVARNADGLYVNKRSYDLLKIKKFDDAEFLCVDVEEGKGKMAGHAVFVCKNTAGTALFKAKMKGDHAALAKYIEHPELVVGRWVTVKYQGLTNKNGVPRFPVALRIREDV